MTNFEIMICPEHKLEMFYAHSTGLYACQNIDCKYAQGVEKHQIDYRQELDITDRWYPR